MTCDPPAPISSPISVRCAAAVRVWGRLRYPTSRPQVVCWNNLTLSHLQFRGQQLSRSARLRLLGRSCYSLKGEVGFFRCRLVFLLVFPTFHSPWILSISSLHPLLPDIIYVLASKHEVQTWTQATLNGHSMHILCLVPG